GDPVLDRDLWAAAKPPLPAETDVLLAENGLRVRVIAGSLPPSFRRLLETDAVHPHGLTFAGRPDDVIPTVSQPGPCTFRVLPDLAGARKDVTLRTASCGILVRPTWGGEGKLRVWCEPQIQYGEREDRFHPTGDGTGLTMSGEVPTERYPGLGFEVVLGPDDHLVIGSPAGADRTLGGVAFSADTGLQARQRVLLVRGSWRGAPPADAAGFVPRGRRPVAAEAAKASR
ncbi:MAG TPA: hypothetical protein VH092_12175, partial [Urbifossiella sp.]|nr:hypothetical protein [Urbifossiella sp.]